MLLRPEAAMDGAPMAGGRWWGGPTATVAASTDVMNQLCRVCGEPAAGFHFGAFTCEGCKSFFGRTYNNLSSISECKNNGCCVINKKNRTSCKACRLRKCLMVGMSKSGSRYGRRSNWFKIHCLLQEQQQQSQQHHQPQQPAQNKSPTWEGLHQSRSHYKPVEDNNNHVPKRITVMSQPPIGIPPNFPHPNEAAAFWAARSSLIAGSHPPSLAMPFLGSPFYQPPRHFLMPFMQTTIPVPPTPMSSSSSSSSSCASERAGEDDRVLGPVQEQPIDLSVRSGGEVPVEATAEGSEHSDSAPESDVEELEGRKRSVTPLDLTTKV